MTRENDAIETKTEFSMKLLIDTNVLIPLEPGSHLNLEPTMSVAAELVKTAQQVGAMIYLHPIQRMDIEQDKNADRRTLRLRLIEKYPQLPNPPFPVASLLADLGNPVEGDNSWIDAHLIASLDRDLVDLLVTEDRGIHKVCLRRRLNSRCRTIQDALARLQDDLPAQATPPPAVRSKLAHELDDTDPIFASLRSDYSGFDGWLAKCRREHRQCWVIELSGRKEYAGICIVNRENRSWKDAHDPTLKICTFKIADDVTGMKLGELLLTAVFNHAVANNIGTLFIEVYPKHATLMHLLECIGFHRDSEKSNGECEMRKRLIPWDDVSSLSPFEFHRQFGPHRVKLDGVKLFVVPIEPRFHSMLFPDLELQRKLFEGTESYGNSIRKAYICNSGLTKLEPGSVLLFYRSQDKQQINAIGVVEETLRTRDADELERFAKKRTVYDRREIDEKTSRGESLGIVFWYAPILRDTISLEELLNAGVVKAAPQSICQIKEEAIAWIRTRLK